MNIVCLKNKLSHNIQAIKLRADLHELKIKLHNIIIDH